MRYPILVVLGGSFGGKTEWAKSLFKHPLESSHLFKKMSRMIFEKYFSVL